jgi:D-hexose-6-phosphate mutarotase
MSKQKETFNTTAMVHLLSHEDEHGMGRVFMYAFLNEVIRQQRPFSFDCESAQVSPNLMIVDNQRRSIAVEHKRNRLSLTLNDQHSEISARIEYKDEAYRQVLLDWLAACIQYTSLQPELRKELTRYAQSIQRRIWLTKVLPVH